MSEPKDMIVPMLREMRQEMRKGFSELHLRIDEVEKSVRSINEIQEEFRKMMIGEGLLSKLVTGSFEDRLASLETKFKRLNKAGRKRPARS